MTTFQSKYHPGDTPGSLVYARALVGPIGACTTPIMIGATAAALQGHPIWGYLVWGLPAALAIATVWTHFTLSATPAELLLKPGQCAIRSIHDVLQDAPPSFHPLYNVRVTPWETELAVGWNTRVCAQSDWPNYPELRKAAQGALESKRQPVASPST